MPAGMAVAVGMRLCYDGIRKTDGAGAVLKRGMSNA